MGYTTEFEGRFTLDRLPSAEVIVQLRALEGGECDVPGNPGGYCQWELTKDCMGIQWDGGEKFYDYVPWLQWIIDTYLKPAGLTLSGSVDYKGEESKDCGVIRVLGNAIEKVQSSPISDGIDDLKRFRDFVLNGDYADEILDAWKRAERRRQGQGRAGR